jgi:hypothetical protein
MSVLHHRTTAVILAAGVLVGGANVAAYAANGHPFLLGKINKETKSATLKNTGNGPAVKFKTKPAAPPFAVSSTTKVAKLNADQLDGLDSTAFANHVLATKCSIGALVGTNVNVCPTSAFTPTVPSVAIVEFGVDAALSSAPGSLWAQANVSADNGAAWAPGTPSWFTADGVTTTSQLAGVSNSSYVTLTPGTTYRFGIRIQNVPAVTGGDGKLTVLIVPMGPGSSVNVARHSARASNGAD